MEWHILGSVGNQNDWLNGGNYAQMSTIVKYKNNLIVAGNFNINGFKEIAQLEENIWLPLGAGVLEESWVNKLVVYKDILYIGGYFLEFENGNPSSFIMAWDGEKYFNPFPNVEYQWQVMDLNVIENELYIVGNFKFKNDNKKFAFAKFDGENFCSFGGSFGLEDAQDPHQIVGLNGDIYVSCNRTMFGDTLNYFAKWIGTEMDSCVYSPVLASIHEYNNTIKNIEIYPNPAYDEIKLSFESIYIEDVNIIISDEVGKEVFNETFVSKMGLNELLVETDKLKKGVYFLKINNEISSITKKIVIFN